MVTIVSDAADADAVAAYFDARDAAGGAMENGESDLSQAFDDVIAKQDSSTWHQVPLSNRQPGLATSGIDSYSGQLAYVAAVKPEWMDVEVVGVAEDAQTIEVVGGAEVAVAVADTVEFSLRSFTPMLIKFVRLLPASTAVKRKSWADAREVIVIDLNRRIFKSPLVFDLGTKAKIRAAAVAAAGRINELIRNCRPNKLSRGFDVAESLDRMSVKKLAIAFITFSSTNVQAAAARGEGKKRSKGAAVTLGVGRPAPPQPPAKPAPFHLGRPAPPQPLSRQAPPLPPAVPLSGQPPAAPPSDQQDRFANIVGMPSLEALMKLAELPNAWKQFLPIASEYCFTADDARRGSVVHSQPVFMQVSVNRALQQAKERGSPQRRLLLCAVPRARCPTTTSSESLWISSRVTPQRRSLGCRPVVTLGTTTLSRRGRSTRRVRMTSSSRAIL